MQNNPEKNHVKYGLIAGVIMVVISLLFMILEVDTKSPVHYLVFFPYLIAVIMNCMDYGKSYNHQVTFGKVFWSGFRMSMIVTIIIVIWTIISLYLFPEIKERALEQAIVAMEEQGQSEEVVEKAIEVTKKFFLVAAISGAMFMYLILGAVFSLIGALITKRNPQQPQFDIK